MLPSLVKHFSTSIATKFTFRSNQTKKRHLFYPIPIWRNCILETAVWFMIIQSRLSKRALLLERWRRWRIAFSLICQTCSRVKLNSLPISLSVRAESRLIPKYIFITCFSLSFSVSKDWQISSLSVIQTRLLIFLLLLFNLFSLVIYFN